MDHATRQTQCSSDQVLDEIVRRIVAVADPDRVILFGSRARGEAGPDSDYDILVIGPTDLSPVDRVVPLYRAGVVGAPKDIVWWTEEEAAEWASVKSHFITTALREGRVVYERAG